MKFPANAAFLALMLGLGVGACQGEKAPEQNGAAGEILPASVSDAMLPLDTVRSQPPLAPQVDPGGRPGDRAHGTPDGSDEEADAEASEPAPAASGTTAPAAAASAAAE